MDRAKQVTEWRSGLPETPCGAGSKFERTEIVRKFIPEVIEQFNVRSIADVGCGDQNWIHHCLPEHVVYTGYDVMPRQQDVQPFDVSREVLPWKFDLVLCIYVLNHMYPDQAERALRLIKESGAKYLLMSYCDGDQYAIPGEPILTQFNHDSGRHVWHYGVWEL